MSNTFVWDEQKQLININKHKISFDEATSVFDDPHAFLMPDELHSDEENRFIIIGMSKKANVLLVCHCYRNGDSLIRIISARKATKHEEALYGGDFND